MLTVLEAINLSTDYLQKKNIESPRLNAELLLAEVLSCKRIDLYLSFDRPLKDNEIKIYREFIRRRGLFEPLQYILGKVNFYNIDFKINKNVLIPRQETEILVDTIISKYNKVQKLNILEVGVGSGIISIVIAKNLVNVNVTAIDISKEALEVAKENAMLNDCTDKINFIEGDVKEIEFNEGIFDLIVSNPPYISKEEYYKLQKEIIDYEPKYALTDDDDGLTFYKVIIDKARKWLKKNGIIFFELGYGQSNKVNDLLIKGNFTSINVIKDLQNIDRVICGEKIWEH